MNERKQEKTKPVKLVGQRHHQFKVGHRTVDIWYDDQQLQVQWDPEAPKGWTADELAQYRVGRDTFLDQIAQELGGKVLVVEV